MDIYRIDDDLKSLTSVGKVDIRTWYEQGTTFAAVTLFTGAEEILLLDSTNRARIYRFTSQQFR